MKRSPSELEWMARPLGMLVDIDDKERLRSILDQTFER
jgi:hypothetical protein